MNTSKYTFFKQLIVLSTKHCSCMGTSKLSQYSFHSYLKLRTRNLETGFTNKNWLERIDVQNRNISYIFCCIYKQYSNLKKEIRKSLIKSIENE